MHTALVVRPGAGNSFRISHDDIVPCSSELVHARYQQELRQLVQDSLAVETRRQPAWFLPRDTMNAYPSSFTAVLLLKLQPGDLDDAQELWQAALQAFDPERRRLPFFHLLDIGPPDAENVDPTITPGPVAMVADTIPLSAWSQQADRHPKVRALYQRAAALERVASDLGARRSALQPRPFDVAGALR